ncbi:FtsH protease activity modulator HflK [Chitinasiproducens palmae]|uniref:Protein HflK n=1 Tax=Chitinasiproducens palmae TaxID=1770053 RepID=A0A1H2PXP1_9BURK|nr:FtsH protease activity modulator HflK [Chitinasiproducens palmae]SDV51411.1 membrane protease subunit HflK [Chitinasiproducens palmae]
MAYNENLATFWQRARAVFNLNDPRWGRGEGGDPSRNEGKNGNRNEGGGPPDLDELWRDFNRRLNRLFRRNGPSGEPPRAGGSGRSAPSGRIGIALVVAVLLAAWLGSGVYIVHEGQAGVVLRFGKYTYTTPAGIQWRLPYPFESNEIVNMSQVRSIEIGRGGAVRDTNLKDSSMLTADENIIDVRFAVQYRIKNAADFVFNNADAESNVAQAAETAVREIVGKSKMDYVLYEGREQVAQQLTQSIQRILDAYRTGILVTSVTMQNVQPPEQVQAAFDDAVKAGQDRERQKNEAQAYANDVVPRARGAAARIVEEAEGYKAKVVAQAQGDAERFGAILAEYNKSPAVTRERMYLDTMQQIFSRASKVLVDGRSNNLTVLPIDKLIGATAASAAPAQATADDAGAAAPSAPAAGAPAARAADASAARSGRDSLRSRTRSYDDVR